MAAFVPLTQWAITDFAGADITVFWKCRAAWRIHFDFKFIAFWKNLHPQKIFSERYNFRINMNSSRCRFIPKETDICPGRISECQFCTRKEDCHNSGGSAFSVYFPPAPWRLPCFAVVLKYETRYHLPVKSPHKYIAILGDCSILCARRPCSTQG